jgi:hypothetical protein
MNAARVFSILTIVAGAILAIDALLYFAPAGVQPWWGFDLGMFVLAVSFLVGAVALRRPLLERIAFWVAAIGYFLVTIGSVNAGLHVVTVPGAIIALVGSVGLGILVFGNNAFGKRADLIYLIGMILSGIYCLAYFLPFPGLTDLFVTIAFGIVLVLAGVFVLRRR